MFRLPTRRYQHHRSRGSRAPGDGVAGRENESSSQWWCIMSGINGVGANTPLQAVKVAQPVSKAIPANAPKALPMTDKVQLSHVNQMMATLKAGGDIRADK